MGIHRLATTGETNHCRNGPRMWLKVRRENVQAIPKRIVMWCGDVYVAVQFMRKGLLYERISHGSSLPSTPLDFAPETN